MKNNRGVTLVALVVIIVLLLVFSLVAIYTARDSYKIIDIQRYKVQMQLIQSAVDELYEEFENEYKKNPELFGGTVITKDVYADFWIKQKYYNKTGNDLKNIFNQKEDGDPVTSWWNNPKFGISTTNPKIQKQYYYFTKNMVEDFLGVSELNISEGFIINFQERFVFSETPIYVNGTEAIYSLYQLNEEEKVIEYKVNDTNGISIGRILKFDIMDVKKDYQKIKMMMDNTRGETGIISELYYCRVDLGRDFEFDSSEEADERFTDVTNDTTNTFEEISGINAKELTIKIKTEGIYIFKLVDSLGNEYYSDYVDPISIKFHEPPVLENNLIPFIQKEDDSGNPKWIVYPEEGKDDKNEWYNYSQDRYATAVISSDAYEERKGKTFDLSEQHIVKVWVPKSLYGRGSFENFTYITNTNFINKTGIWVGAVWDEGTWKPDLNYNPYNNNNLIFEFDGTKIDENTTLANMDTSSNRHTFTGSGVTFDKERDCMNFNGSGGLVSVEKFEFGNEFTMEVVLKPENNPKTNRK